MEYKYEENVIILYIDSEDDNSSSKIDSLHGEDETIINITGEDIDVLVKEIRDANDDFPNYVAQWEKDNVIYQISGKMEKDEFYKVIEKIRY